ncbi:MAG TPA: T9SS type A sorting domain-containing protein [Flavobacterium sp.]|jgi:uncharacterized repeat protein (TIGR01451 family)
MAKFYLLILLLAVGPVLRAQIVNIPDAGFKEMLLNYTPDIDTNNDNEIQVAEAEQVTELLIYNYVIHDIEGIQAFSNLQYVESEGYAWPELDFSGMANLETISLQMIEGVSSVNLAGCVNLKHLDLFGTFVWNWNADFSGLPALETIDCSQTQMASINLSGLTNLTSLKVANNEIEVLDIAALTSLTYLDCRNNSIEVLDVSALTGLTYLNCSTNQDIAVLDVAPLTNLEYLYCTDNQISSLDVSGLTPLKELDASYNSIATLEVSALINLEKLYCSDNNLTQLDVAPLVDLKVLWCGSNPIPALDVTTLTLLEELNAGGCQLSQLDVTHNTQLHTLVCDSNNLTALDIAQNLNLEQLLIAYNQLTTIDVSDHHLLKRFGLSGNLFTTLDLSASLNDDSIDYQISNNPNLTYINLKNGADIGGSFFNVANCPNLEFICADEHNIPYIIGQMEWNNVTGVQVNSYCSFTPGGTHNTIEGTLTVDVNGDGCDGSDVTFPNIKVGLVTGTDTGATFTTSAGGYAFFTGAGTFTLTPEIHLPYFTVVPASQNVSFDANDGSAQTVNFCISPLGIHNDLEISIVQLAALMPGFDVSFRIVYKNKGNQVMTGSVIFGYPEPQLDYVSATQAPSGTNPGSVQWDFSNMLPFESRTIDVVLNANAPTETPPVQLGDVIFFNASVNPIANDETPEDNVVEALQTVVGSFDPNDKTCMEGNTLTTDMIGEYLHYLIRFQNSGTAPAQNIVVKDVIDTSEFDLSSLQMIAMSHPGVVRITNNIAEFIFEGINLPAEQDNEPGSHGFVSFKIRTLDTLVEGNTASNTADIYFDYNFPIVTNTAETTFSNLGVNQHESIKFNVMPNPVRDSVTISSEVPFSSVSIYDIQGRLLAMYLNDSPQAEIDLSNNRSGVYFLKMEHQNGSSTIKIVKE